MVGGQAVMEGVMMRVPGAYATAVRDPNGNIQTNRHNFISLSDKYPILKKPLLRGIIGLFESLKIGFALETSDGEKNAKKKLDSKSLDYIILNYANEENAGFDSNTNHLFLYSKEGLKKEFILDTKYRLSLNLIKTIIKNEKNK